MVRYTSEQKYSDSIVDWCIHAKWDWNNRSGSPRTVQGLPDCCVEYRSVKSDALYSFAASAGVEPYQIAS